MRLRVGSLLGQPTPLILVVEVAGIVAIIGGEAGVDLVHADDDRLGVGPALDHRADEGRHGQTPLGVDRVERAPVEEVLEFHLPACPRTHRPSRSRARVSSRSRFRRG
jgi:hypothetical protein